MDTTLLILVVLGFALYFWSRARDASEVARKHGLDACERAGVQLLDHSVALVKLGLRRGNDGRLGMVRQYRFDYSREGSDRASGALALHGLKLLWITAPEPLPPPSVPEPPQARLQGRSFGHWG
jgi:hypothetical protein